MRDPNIVGELVGLSVVYCKDEDLGGEPAGAEFSSRSGLGQVISAQTYVHCNCGCNCGALYTALVPI